MEPTVPHPASGPPGSPPRRGASGEEQAPGNTHAHPSVCTRQRGQLGWLPSGSLQGCPGGHSARGGPGQCGPPHWEGSAPDPRVSAGPCGTHPSAHTNVPSEGMEAARKRNPCPAHRCPDTHTRTRDRHPHQCRDARTHVRTHSGSLTHVSRVHGPAGLGEVAGPWQWKPGGSRGRGRGETGPGVHLLDELHQGFGLELLNPGFIHAGSVVHLGLPLCLAHAGRGVFWNHKGQRLAAQPRPHTGQPRERSGVLSCGKGWRRGLSV